MFLIGIGIPCLLLGYLAFRGIQNDQALLEKERLNDHRKILEHVTGLVEDNLLKAERTFSGPLLNTTYFYQPELIASIDSCKKQNPILEEIFILGNDKIHFPFARLLFLPDGGIQTYSSSSQAATEPIRSTTGQRLEFQQKNYAKALASYRKDFEQTSDPQIKGELLSSIARVQKKSALFQDAVKTYNIIARGYSNVQTTGGVPLGLAARLEIGSLSMSICDTLTAIRTFSDLYKDLLGGEWTLERAQFAFFSQNITETVDRIFSHVQLSEQVQWYKSIFAESKAEELNQRKITERLLTFQEKVADLKAKVTLIPEEFRNTARRYTVESGDQTFLVSIMNKYEGNEIRENENWGLLLNTDYLRDSLLRQALQNNTSSVKTGWLVKGRDEKTILKSDKSSSGTLTVRTNFEGSFPPWFIELYQTDPDLFETFLFSRRGIYFLMFILLAGILIFGLILTVRTVSHELELSKMKSDFVSTISHEFKSPLSSIRQLSEMLQSGRIPSEDYRQQYYDVLVEQSERLALLIDNILDFSKIEEGKKKFDFEMVDIGLILHETVTIIQDQVRHKDFDIHLKVEKSLPLIKADRAAIAQAITNLIDNAIKYSGEAKNILVGASAEDQYLIITVKDFGIGIRKEEIDKVFERFYRGGDELTRTVKGSGLGLTLVKQIVEVHHGTISVESEPGNGSIFSVRLPLTGI